MTSLVKPEITQVNAHIVDQAWEDNTLRNLRVSVRAAPTHVDDEADFCGSIVLCLNRHC